MSKKFIVGYVVFIFFLALFTGYNFIVKKETLNGLNNLKYVKGTIEYYESRPSPIDKPQEIRKKLHIKLNESNQIYKDGPFLLAGLDKDKFIALIDADSKIELGVNKNDFYYDIAINNTSLVNLDKIKGRLKMEKYGSILGVVAFLLYGIYELKKVLK